MADANEFQTWEKQKFLGQGGFGEVHLVLTDRGDQLAAKYIPLAAIGVQAIPQAVEMETNILKQLNHPNVVRFVTTKKHGNDMVVFTEYINGSELGALGKLCEAEAKVYLRQICDGLNYLHTRSPAVLHRDIKGGNIMVASNGTVKLIDFGISINVMAASGVNVSQAIKTTKNAIGTLPFMAPELFKSPSQFSVKSDVWALGITVYQMMAGRPPFATTKISTEEAVNRITTSGAPPLPRDCSHQLMDFYACCTAENPADRKSVPELLQHGLFGCGPA